MSDGDPGGVSDAPGAAMRLQILLPDQVLLDAHAMRIVAEAENGSFGILPRHVDCVAALVPGLLSYVTPEGEEVFVAVDKGILVKNGADVLVSVHNAVRGTDLGSLRQLVAATFETVDERERRARSALARLEAGFVRRFLELNE